MLLYEELTSVIIGKSYEVMNYLSASELLVGLIINFGKQKVQTSRLEHPKILNSII